MQEQSFQFDGRASQESDWKEQKTESKPEPMQEQPKVRNIKQSPKDIQARNRRYMRLKQLWKEGYFEQQQIMLRFPQLYYDYVGQYKKTTSPNFTSMCQFLQKQIISTQYRNLLHKANPQLQQQQAQSPYQQKLQDLSPADLELQEQALIDEIELMFIEGELEEFDYGAIDGDQGLDGGLGDRGLEEQELEEKYCGGEEEEERDLGTNTGIQDF